MSKPHVQHPQKGPTKIDLDALRSLADKAGFDLVPKGRLQAFTAAQAVDPLRAERLDYRDAIRRSFVRQAADWLLQEDALAISDEAHAGGAISTRAVLVVVMPERPAPAEPAPGATDEDPLS